MRAPAATRWRRGRNRRPGGACRLGRPALLPILGLLVSAGCASTPTAEQSAARPPADAREVTERQVLVTLRPAPVSLLAQITRDLEILHGIRTVLSWPMASLGERCVVFEIPRHRTAGEVARRVAASAHVSLAQPIQVFSAQAAGGEASAPANDPYAHLQHAATELNLAGAHRHATGRGVRIGVVDTGVDVDHPDLRGRVAQARNFVDRGEQTFTSDIHGTAVAGAIAAGRNQVGIVGVAPEAAIYALKACWPEAPGTRQALCNSYTLARAVDFAILEGVQVLNFSLTGPQDPLLRRLLETALRRGITVVAAQASGTGSSPAAGFPASVPGVLAVADAGAESAGRAPAASGPAVTAPGVDILTTVPRGSYDFFSGSSLAAAQVSGVVALLLQHRPALTPSEVRAAIADTMRPLAADRDGGGTIVDACAAVKSVLPAADCGPQ